VLKEAWAIIICIYKILVKKNRMTTASLLRKGKILEYVTLGWNIIGVFVLVLATQTAHSVSLTAFGFDTLLEIGASAIVIWELNGTNGSRQKKGLRLLGIGFLALGIYILLKSMWSLMHYNQLAQSLLGIIWLMLTFIAMSTLAWNKFQVGKLLNNAVLLTEGRVTLIDAALAAIVLISMLLSGWLGLWWADSAGGFVLTGYCFWEAVHAWSESKNHVL